MFPLAATHLDLLTPRPGLDAIADADEVPHPTPSYYRPIDQDETNIEVIESLISSESLPVTYRAYTGVRSRCLFVVLIFQTAYTKPLKLPEADLFLRAYALAVRE